MDRLVKTLLIVVASVVGIAVLALVAVLLFSAWQHFELLRHGYGIEQMEQDRALELELNRHLRLEIETLRSLRRIEQIATEELNLVAPTPAEAQVIERIGPAAPPDRSVVVSRDSATPAGRRP